MMNNKALSYLGLSMRAGKLVTGEKLCSKQSVLPKLKWLLLRATPQPIHKRNFATNVEPIKFRL